jgi:hypothetical protein
MKNAGKAVKHNKRERKKRVANKLSEENLCGACT